MRYSILILLLFTGCRLVAQEAGYRSIVATDSSRRYKPGADLGNRLYYRPIELDCWYPAEAAGGDPLRYGEFLELFEQRATRFQDDTVYTGLAGQVATYLCGGLGIEDTARLMRFATQSYRNAAPIPGHFPLLVYMCSYNGMCYENVRLFETLARHGYMVVSITSVGRYPGNMTTDPADLREQVADGLFAIKLLQNNGAFDTARLGLIGYSWGGPGAMLLAGLASVKAVLSLDGSELHYYFGKERGEDSDFDRLRPGLIRAAKRRFAYAYLDSDGKQSEGAADSIYDILPTFRGPKKYLHFPGASHEDFSCLPYLAARIRRMDTSGLPGYVDFAVGWFDNYFKGAHNRLPADSRYPVVSAPAHTLTIRAKVLDAEDDSPLAYVNVGFPGKNAGTVTGEDGSFELAVDVQLASDSLAISMAGYEKRVIPLKRMPKVIRLRRRSLELAEAVVTSGIRRTRIVGNKSESKLVSVGFPMRFTGAEIGVRMAMGKQPRRLEKFHCHVTAVSADSAVFRVNVYRIVRGTPENILQRNILLSIGKAPGDYTLDLSGMNITVAGNMLVSLELLRSYSSSPGSGAVFFSAGLFSSATWRRPTSQAEWKKARGIGLGFNVEIR